MVDYLIWTPFLYMLCWGLPYYCIVFVIMKKTIKEKALGTLYDQMCREGGQGWWIAKHFAEEQRPFVYILVHLIFTMATGR